MDNKNETQKSNNPYYYDSSNFNGVKQYHHSNFIKIGMIILFIITITSLIGPLISLFFMGQLVNQHDQVRNMWVCWCWLPIPIMSIILGFKYTFAGYKCIKNIVAGFIIGFQMLVYGSFCIIFPSDLQDYSKIDTYRTIINANLPNNGELEIHNWGGVFDDDKSDYTIINVYYDKEDVSNKEDVSDLASSIENNDTWILSQEIKTELKIFISPIFYPDKDAYYSIYNKTTNQYNTLPEKSGNYEIYVMKYDKSDKKLEIHKFIFSYRR